MDPRFNEIASRPENQIFQTVFAADRIYHSKYLNATRSNRYRYNVSEVRHKFDMTVLKGEVYLDGASYTSFLRIEYRSGRLVEEVREKRRFIGENLLAYIKVSLAKAAEPTEAMVRLHFCPWIRAFQVELWGTLEPPTGMAHDIKVRSMMGSGGSITRIKSFANALANVGSIKRVEMAAREADVDEPLGYKINIGNAAWDNNLERTIQIPNMQHPNASENTVRVDNYAVDFQRGWYLDARETAPVRYLNGMLDRIDYDHSKSAVKNIIEIRWLLQQELGGSLTYFNEVTIPAGCSEGAHRHIGSEEVFYFVEGNGVAHLGEGDDPRVSQSSDGVFPLKEIDVFCLSKLPTREVPVNPGKVIFTKSGGIHGIENTGSQPLRFIAFGYHTI